MAQKSWEARLSTLAVEASEGLRRLGARVSDDEPVKTRIARAARSAGLSYWRAFDLWYRKARQIGAAELEAIRAATARRSREEPNEIVAIAKDMEALAQRLSALASPSDREAFSRMRALAQRVRHLAPGE